MQPVCLNLGECNAIGDLICATPTIRVLRNAYDQKITVLSKIPELFKNNPNVEKSYKISSVDLGYFESNYLMHNSFYNVGKKNELGVEYKHNAVDIRQFHSINLGFMLTPDEMHCEYQPTEECTIELPKKYVVIHPVQNWPSRTWSEENWIELTKRINDMGMAVVAIGKDSSETGFFNVDKPSFNFEIENGLNLINKTTISDCYHIIKNSLLFISMDSGLLHLAGTTTNTLIVQLGSSINPFFRAPYRLGSQSYQYMYIRGGCGLACASDLKYGVKQWGNIQGVPPLIGCLEGKENFECHPSVEKIMSNILILIN
jgi:ADP-heptose:LPS heptosyltransferase